MAETTSLNDLWSGFTDGDGSKLPEINPQATTPPAQQQVVVNPTPAQQQGADPGEPARQTAPPVELPKPADTPPVADAPKPGEPGYVEPAADPAEGDPADPNADPNADPADDPLGFWNDVTALRGRPLDVDLSVFEDPTSPEAYMAVEAAVRKESMADYDQFVEETDPRAYAYFLHRRAGGSDQEFFEKTSDQLPEHEVFKGNVDLQKRVYTSALKSRGVSDKIINLTIAEAEKDGTLFAEADKEYQEQKTKDSALLNNMKAENERREQAYLTQVNAIEDKIDNIVFKNATERIVIPEAKKNEFANYLKGKLIHDDQSGQFIIGQRVTPENITGAIEALYFQFAGGDLDKLVTRKATTQIARGLGSKVAKARTAAVAAQNKDNNVPAFTPLTQLF